MLCTVCFHQSINDQRKKFPSNRIRTSDLEIAAEPLQSPALPTELSTADLISSILSILFLKNLFIIIKLVLFIWKILILMKNKVPIYIDKIDTLNSAVDSSVGRAGDCRGSAVISRSLVRIRFDG